MNILDTVGTVIFSGLVGGGVAWVIVTYLSKTILTHQLTKDIEKFKAELEEKSTLLKNQLSIFAHEHTVAISRIDAQTAKAIHTVYNSLRLWINPATRLATGCPIENASEDMKIDWYLNTAEEAHRAGANLVKVFCDHAIYFDDNIYSLMGVFAETGSVNVAIFLSPIRQGMAEGAPPEDLMRFVEQKRKVFAKTLMETTLPQMNVITTVFRLMLGVSAPKPGQTVRETVAMLLDECLEDKK